MPERNPYINMQVTAEELDLIKEAVLALRPERQSLELDEYLEI